MSLTLTYYRFTIISQAKIESRLTSSESARENLSQSDEEFFQKAFRAYCLSEIHLHHMVSIKLATDSSTWQKGQIYVYVLEDHRLQCACTHTLVF